MNMDKTSAEPTVLECVQHIRNGSLRAEDLLRQSLKNIEQTDKQIQAWVSIDTDQALNRAQQMDEWRQKGRPLGRLHGIPVGVKDIVDTDNLPTEFGSPVYKGHQPKTNAHIVDKLLEAGAVIVGKTVTTEFAWMNESQTRNPHNLAHSPGGSSSGSAAAVAAGHVPLAIGSQTGGSVIRPASFNGVFGFKPSRGLISRSGVLQTSHTLDQLGVFGRNLGDLGILVDAIHGFDRMDSLTKAEPKPKLLHGYQQETPAPPAFAWIDMPYSSQYSQDINEAFNELLTVIESETDASLDRLPSPASFHSLIEAHQVIHDYEIVRNLDSLWQSDRHQLSQSMHHGLTRAEGRTDADYSQAMELKSAAEQWFEQFFYDYDAIITPAALDTAPLLGQGTGDPACCLIWTLCGLPCVSLPMLTASDNLPIGVQLVGRYERDDRLLRTCNWLLSQLEELTQSQHET